MVMYSVFLPAIFKVLNFLQPSRMLAVEDYVLLGDDRHLSCSLGLAESVVCAACVDADIMYSNVLDGQSHVTKIEKCRDS